MHIRSQYSTLVQPRLDLARGGMANPADLPPDIRSQSKVGRRWRSEPMHGEKCSHDPGATITTAPEEAASRMKLHWPGHWLAASEKWRKRKSRAERGTCRLKKGAPEHRGFRRERHRKYRRRHRRH